MSQGPGKTTIGEKVSLENIESTFRQYWRDAVDSSSRDAVLKASTLNLVVFIDDKDQYQQMLSHIHDITSNHPGRIIIAFLDPDRKEEEIEAHVSAYSQKLKDGHTQISAELVILETGEQGSAHLAGAILPLLLPDLPVYFWCTSTCALINPDLNILFQYTDRLIVTTPAEYETSEELSSAIDNILALHDECMISDISWAQLTDWREALAQFFDGEKNSRYINSIQEVDIVYSGQKLSNHAFLMAGWLSASLRHVTTPATTDDSTIYFKRQSERLSITIRKKNSVELSGLLKVKLFAQENEKAVIFTVTAMPDGSIQTTVQKGGALYPPHYLARSKKSRVEMLCNELDFLQQDTIYLNACKNIFEYLNES